MFVRFHLQSSSEFYALKDVTCVGICKHKFPSGRTKKCLNLIKGNGDVLNFEYSDVCNLLIEDFEGQRHTFNEDSKIIFVEDGQTYERCDLARLFLLKMVRLMKEVI